MMPLRARYVPGVGLRRSVRSKSVPGQPTKDARLPDRASSRTEVPDVSLRLKKALRDADCADKSSVATTAATGVFSSRICL